MYEEESGFGVAMVKFPFRGVSKGVSWDSSQRGLRGFHECSWSYLLMQDWLHHCLSEQPLAEHCKSICWTQTHPPQVSWMEGQTTVENKVADLNSYHIQLGLNLQMIPLPGSKKALPCSVTAHPAGLGGPGAPSPPQTDLAQGCSQPRHSSLCQLLLMDFQLKGAQCLHCHSD